MRTAVWLALIACGGDDDFTPKRDAAVQPSEAAVDVMFVPPPDAPMATNAGFKAPTAVVAAWNETSPGSGMYTAQTLDLSCLGMARNDPATTTQVSLAVDVRDFQSGNVMPNAQVKAFVGVEPSAELASGVTDASGDTTLTIAQNTTRIGFVVTHTNARPTYTFDRLLAPSMMNQGMQLASVSNSTVATLPALIGVSHDPNKSLAIGIARDCQGHTLSNFVATVSTTTAVANHVAGATTYYFSDAVGLPVNHNQAAQGARDGLFMVISVPMQTNAYMQVWGFRDANELAAQTLKLIAELAIPVPMSAVVLVDHEPRSTM